MVNPNDQKAVAAKVNELEERVAALEAQVSGLAEQLQKFVEAFEDPDSVEGGAKK
jgi:regulator of replication initiation timing